MKEILDCTKNGLHLTDCDNDGFCNHCGYQETYLPYAISTSDGHDEDWTYYASELEAHETFIYMQGYESDIHLFKLNYNFEYEVIDSWWDGDEK
jgi:hypothetical protein